MSHFTLRSGGLRLHHLAQLLLVDRKSKLVEDSPRKVVAPRAASPTDDLAYFSLSLGVGATGGGRLAELERFALMQGDDASRQRTERLWPRIA